MRSCVLLIMVVLMAGCAASQLGRQQPVDTAEKIAFDCTAIAIEIAKCDDFVRKVQTRWEQTKEQRFWGGLTDLGIGDREEKVNAIESSDSRREDLVVLAKERKCLAPPLAPPHD